MDDSTVRAPAAPVVPTAGRLRPLGIDEVRITGGFWAERQAVNSRGTVPHVGERLESAGWLPNFDLASSGVLPAGRRGREFADSEVYKYLEALAWEIVRTGDEALEQTFRRVVARVAAAQADDGYLNTQFGREGQARRWSDLEWGHELYCLGHLFQAAVARARTRPDADDGLLAVAVRAANLVCDEFGSAGDPRICGHPEIEMGLAELARVTGVARYAELARAFVERRGRGTLADVEWGRAYYQDDVPVRSADVLRGHAVRANYLAAGAVDVAIEAHDKALLAALRTQWEHTVARRTYITGAQGSHHQDEAFGADWELPPDRAYAETCAGIGSLLFGWRMLLADGDPRYADLIERTLYNVVAASTSDDGCAFFYSNTLHQRVPGQPLGPCGISARAATGVRAPWFEVSCCPTNLARTMASLACYLATVDDEGIQLHQYAAACLRTTLPEVGEVLLDVETDYPESGVVRLIVRSDAPRPWTLTARVPSWASGARARLVPVSGVSRDWVVPRGVLTITERFRAGDVVELDLPMAPRITRPGPRIDAIRGCIAVERGPVVHALESVDLALHGLSDVNDIVAIEGVPPIVRDGRVWLALATDDLGERGWPYGEPFARTQAAVGLVPMVPYYGWARRGPSTMRVWIPTT